MNAETRKALAPLCPDRMAKCPECEGDGWTVGIATEPRCCGRSDYECGGRGCTGPEPEQVQIQEQCEYCLGEGSIEISGEEPPALEGDTA